jgi:hypothetical protein
MAVRMATPTMKTTATAMMRVVSTARIRGTLTTARMAIVTMTTTAMGMMMAVPTVQTPDRGRVAGETVGLREMAEAKAIPTTMAQVREVALSREARGTMEMETLILVHELSVTGAIIEADHWRIPRNFLLRLRGDSATV